MRVDAAQSHKVDEAGVDAHKNEGRCSVLQQLFVLIIGVDALINEDRCSMMHELGLCVDVDVLKNNGRCGE